VGFKPTDPEDLGLRFSIFGDLLLGALYEEAITVGLARLGSVQLTPALCSFW